MSQTSSEAETRITAPASAPSFLVHNEGDQVGVAVQDVAPGERVAVYLDSERSQPLAVHDPIPLGHKVALFDLPEGADVIEYGVRIGLTRQPIAAGHLVHTHNLRSARWPNSR